jgi:hypothetical protein
MNRLGASRAIVCPPAIGANDSGFSHAICGPSEKDIVSYSASIFQAKPEFTECSTHV